MSITVGFGCVGAEPAVAENVPRLASARTTPPVRINKPNKIRTLKKADREADFFFMNGYDVGGVSAWSAVCSGAATGPQHFFVWMAALGFIGAETFWQAFSDFFCTSNHLLRAWNPGF